MKKIATMNKLNIARKQEYKPEGKQSRNEVRKTKKIRKKGKK